ncbi:MAG: hypothetical protein II364_03165 [Bacteroidales bacterium]|jgi:hypothetical protein|nr:hypothetical protein [Bacteroidales bacterium]MBQ1937944.1 hypothetical protein [Bacteroidales bacterium]
MRSKHHIVALLVCLGALLSCSVKENREECPYWLRVDVKPALGAADTVAVRCWSSEKKLFFESLPVADYADSLVYERVINRRDVLIATWWNEKTYHKAQESENYFCCDYGFAADSLYGGHLVVDTHTDDVVLSTPMHKQFATVFVTFKDYSGSLNANFFLESDYNALDVKTLTPCSLKLTGDPDYDIFHARLVRQGPESRLFVTRILRQPSDVFPSTMRIVAKDDMGNVRWRLNLEEILSEYNEMIDWDKESLDDIHLTVTDNEFAVRPEDWEEGFDKDDDF